MISLFDNMAEFHHIGIACRSLEREKLNYIQLGYRVEGDQFVDELQGVKGIFLAGAGPRLEILESLPGRNTLRPWLESGAKMYHLAYEVDELYQSVEWAVSKRHKLISEPKPAVAFSGRLIVFIMLRNQQLIELIQKNPHNKPLEL